MRLRSFSLSKIVPVEIINLIVQESSDSDSTLHAWSLVSFGCLSIAGPLLNEHVWICDQKQLGRVLQRMTLDETDPLIRYLPRLSSFLSLKNVRRLTFTINPDAVLLKQIAEGAPSPQSQRPRLHLDFALGGMEAESSVVFGGFSAPTLLKLLQPGSFSDGSRISSRDDIIQVRSWALQIYYTIILNLTTLATPSLVPPLGVECIVLAELYSAIVDFQKTRDIIRLLVEHAPRHAGSQWSKDAPAWADKVETLEIEETEKLVRLREEGGDIEDAPTLGQAAHRSALQLAELTTHFSKVLK